jgi:concanavalin A-like lectin/glucanase superfamily protein
MTYQKNRKPGRIVRSIHFWLPALAFLGAAAGCGGATDQRFAPESYDEYTEPLTNAIVGSPAGVVTIGPVDAGPPQGGSTPGSTGGAMGTSTASGTGVGIGRGGGGTGGGTGTSTGTGGATFDGGPAEDGGVDGGTGGGFGFWHFDDCSPKSNFLVDSSGEGANAQHALGAACVPGISGLGVDIRSAKDVIQVPDEPQFTVSTRVAVAAWVKPTTVKGDQPIVIKRLNNQTSFSLGIHNGNIQMSVVLKNGTTVISQAPISAGTWSHVAGMYDGTFLFLFIDGQQFGQVYAGLPLRDVFAPIRIGATTQSQYFSGVIDDVFVSTEAITAQTLTALACFTNPSTFTVNPATASAEFDSTVHYDVAVTDNDIGFCGQKEYDFFLQFFDPTINTVVDQPQFVSDAQPGTTLTFGVDVTPTDSSNPGSTQIPFIVESFPSTFTGNFEFLQGNLNLNILAPTGCFVFTGRELMITDVSVVDDPVRTFGVSIPGFDGGTSVGVGSSGGNSGGSGSGVVIGGPVPVPPPLTPATGGVAVPASTFDVADAQSNPDVQAATDAQQAPASSQGVWTFGHLMRELAPTPDQAPAMTLALFQHWLTDQTVNGFTVTARPAMQQVLLDVWPKTATGDLDLDQPPLTLQAIVNRIDIRNLAAGSAGEGRFVFAVNGQGFPQLFTVILEYNLPAQTQQDVQDWANLWHSLSSHPFPSEEYNAALEAITRKFSDRNASPGSPNGSALIELRTNEIALSNIQWELRAFALSPTSGFFDETTIKETPDLSFLGTQTFADFVNQNATAIKAEIFGANDNTVPLTFEGQNFLGGSVFNNQVEWNGPGIVDPDARFHASANTCNGCHGPETGTFNFTMINPRSFGTQAQLSPFLTGTSVTDPFSGQTRSLNDLSRRHADLTGLVCPSDGGSPADTGAPPPPPDTGAPPPPSVDGGTAGKDASSGKR